jgi:transposase-like protein
MNQRPFAALSGNLLVPVVASSHFEAAGLAIAAALDRYGQLPAGSLAPMISVSDGVSADQSYTVADVLLAGVALPRDEHLVQGPALELPLVNYKPGKVTYRQRAPDEHLVNGRHFKPTRRQPAEPADKPRAPRRKRTELPPELRSPSGFPIVNVLDPEEERPSLARQRFTDSPKPLSVEWRIRHLAACVLSDSATTREAARRLGISKNTLATWRREGHTMYLPRLGPRMEPVVSDPARERRLLAVAVFAYRDLEKAAKAIDMDAGELKRRCEGFGLRVEAASQASSSPGRTSP